MTFRGRSIFATLLVASAIAVTAPTVAIGAPGDVVAGFAEGTDVDYGVRASALTSGDRLVAATRNLHPRSFAVKRLQANGAIDRSFGSNGKTRISLAGWHIYPEDLEVDGEGRTVVSIYGYGGGETGRLLIVRLKPDGTIDESFATDGIAEVGDSFTNAATDITIDSQDRVVYVEWDGDESGLGRLTDSGQPDPDFGSGGFVQTRDFSPGVRVGAVWLDIGPSDTIYMAGYAQTAPGYYPRTIERVSESGEIDYGYGENGIAEVSPDGDGIPAMNAMVIGDDGSAYVATNHLIRIDTSGAVDPGFDPGVSAEDEDSGLAIGAHGKILYAHRGSPGQGFAETMEVDRIGTDGELDHSFGFGGRTFVYRGVHPLFAGSSLDASDRSITTGGYPTKLTLDGGKSDLDGDGVGDKKDRCRWLSAAGHEGCPVIGQKMTIWGSGDSFSVRVASQMPSCRFSVAVRVYRVRRGEDQLISKFAGPYKGFYEMPRGSYYAVTPRLDLVHAGICNGGRTHTIAVG